MKKVLVFLSACILLTCFMTFSAFAAGGYVHDDADILTPSHEQELVEMAQGVGEKHGLDIVIVTSTGISDSMLASYADNYYDSNGYSDDGVLILIVEDSGARFISTCGKAIDIVDPYLGEFSNRTGSLFDDCLYAEAFTECIILVDELSEEHAEKDGSSNIVQSVIINLVIGFVIAFIVTSVMKSSLKSVRMQPMASGYMKNDSFNITRSNDLFLYRTVSRTPRANSSSGGSGTRTSSSGRSHGGGRF